MVLYLIALVAVAVMGFANQRGSICMVAAIEEIVQRKRFLRLLALLEASLWAGGGLILLNVVDRLPATPTVYAAGPATVLGGALFGVGAFWNRACLFGTISKFGTGEWVYAITPLGFYLGCLATSGVHAPTQLHAKSVILLASSWMALVVLILLAVILWSHVVAIRRHHPTELAHVWSPHVATTVIGIMFVVSLSAVGNWTYPEFLTDLAHGIISSWTTKSLLYLSLFAGAVVGGLTARSFKHTPPDPLNALRCLGGGTMMGAGGALIPGGNAGLVLVGMPLLLRYAWLAFITISATVYLAIRIARSEFVRA